MAPRALAPRRRTGVAFLLAVIENVSEALPSTNDFVPFVVASSVWAAPPLIE